MRSRWYHEPSIHTEHHEEKKVSWLELFYDLIFVAAAIQLGDALSSEVAEAHSAFVPLARFAGIYVPLWMTWSGFTFYANRYQVDDFTHRMLVFANMFSVGGMAVTAPHFADSAASSQLFSFALAANFIVVALMNARVWKQGADYSKFAGVWTVMALVTAVVWFGAAFVPTPWRYGVWAVIILFAFAGPLLPFFRQFNERFPIDLEHMSERYGLLTIIVLGESFVKVLSYINNEGYGASAESLPYLLRGAMVLATTCCLWWIYFDDVAGATLRKQRGAFEVWFYSHLPLAIGITAVGVGLKKFVSLDLYATAPAEYRWLLAGALAITLFSVAVIDSVTERQNSALSDKTRVNVRFFSAGLLLILAQAGEYMGAGVFLATITGVCVSQVIFDMIMAPLEETEHDEMHLSTQEAAERRMAGEQVASNITEDGSARIFNVVRKAVPPQFRRDLYSFFLDGSWTQLLFSCVTVYVGVNLLFAGLYLLEPGSISGGGASSFTDAFSFSIQTLTTIGYGTMSPATPYGDLLVSIEAFLGIVGVAIITGLVFAKASRPQAGALFTQNLVVHDRNHVPTLMFRVANARGNEVIDAGIRVHIVIDEITPEGHHMGRSHKLKLASDTSPIFVFSWNVMHVIDETSPLFGMDEAAAKKAVRAIVVTLSGHDVTHGQIVSAKKLYTADDLLWGHHFRDVMGQTEDGRPVIDFNLFHRTVEGDAAALADAEAPEAR